MEVYGLIGNPVGHSLSPPMQEAGFEAIGLDARYVTFEPAVGSAGAAVEAADTLGIRGLNVTIPFKQDVLSHVRADPLAERVGAVNTIVLGDGQPTGHNTDVDGAVRALRHHDVAIDDQRAVVAGAGGAGRAIAVGLADAGATVAIANRTIDRARRLAADLADGTAHDIAALSDLLADADILVNATSVGMESDESVVPASALHAGLTVMDAVYRPPETRLLRDARSAGAETIDGGWMLLFQGAAAFERWTGEAAPIDPMNDALRRQL